MELRIGMSDNNQIMNEAAVAVIGLDCRFPGAMNAAGYWQDIVDGRSRLISLPDKIIRDFGLGSADELDPATIKVFGVLQDVDRFDSELFAIPPRRAARLDPQQRILLELAWNAMEEAGYGPQTADLLVGTFIGLTQSSYFPAEKGLPEDAVFDLTAQEKDYAATRIAHKLGLLGPAMVVQSACSSALLAVHMACEALISGQCDMAIAGGASIAFPQGAYRHVPGLMLSPSGHCRVFDERADGTVPGNGAGVVVLKPLACALADGDPIRAVIRGSASNNDGAIKADYLAPSVNGQALAVGEALAVAGCKPADIGLIEAHATGTKLGDPIEIKALSRIFTGLPVGSIVIGSAKASIGHLNAASGIAGLIKAILALENAKLPPVAGFQTPNSDIPFEDTPFRVAASAEPWLQQEKKRVAGVSSFGFGGTNVHVILEEAPARPVRSAISHVGFPLALSAMNPDQLAILGQRIADALDYDPLLRLDDVSFTLLAGRASLPVRRASVVMTREEAIDWLRGHGSSSNLPKNLAEWVDGKPTNILKIIPKGAQRVRLPGYPFNSQPHWTELVGLMPASTGLAWKGGQAHTSLNEADAIAESETSSINIIDTLVRELLAEALGVQSTSIDSAAPLASFALDSLLTVGITNRLKEKFPRLRDTILFEQESIASLCRYLLDTFPDEIATLTKPNFALQPINKKAVFAVTAKQKDIAVQSSIAIIGMAGRYPDAPDLDHYWKNLQQGVCSLNDVPPERWRVEDFTDSSRLDRTTVRKGGFITDVDRFDSMFFGIAPKEAKLMDPQHRLFLEVAWQAIEEAGYTPAELKRSAGNGTVGDVGVIVGAMNQPYRLVGLPATASGKVVQNGHWSIANRLSYHLDLTGVSMAVDTACSASLTAVHLACAALTKGDCGVVVVGGVNLILHPLQSLELARIGMLSPSDLCRPFADGADGTIQGEGIGAIVLKPLDRALADGDPIRSIILGSAIDAGGRTSGYTVPNPNAQRRVIEAALAQARIDPASIAHVECHGTGTDLGDPIEANALADAMKDRQETILIGSVKGNIGHLESAAGIAGLSKLIMEIEAGEVVPSLGAENLSKRIDFIGQKLEVVTTLRSWPCRFDSAGKLQPRRGGISSFGAGGSNAHLVIEQAPVSATRAAAPTGLIPLFLSARDSDRLSVIASRLADRVEAMAMNELDGRAFLADVAYTLVVGRVVFDHRCVINVDDVVDALAQLRSLSPSSTPTIKPDEIVKMLGLGRRRVALPGYPFAGQSYWVEGAARPITIPNKGPLFSASSSLEDSAISSRLGDLALSKHLHIAADDPLIDQHRVRGLPTMPGVASVLAALRVYGKAAFGVRNVVWLRALVSEGSGLDFKISITGDVFVLETCKGVACKGYFAPSNLLISPSIPQGGKLLNGKEFYDRLLDTGLEYRGNYRLIDAVRMDHEFVVATIDTSVISDRYIDWPFPPPLLDAALQVAAGMTLPQKRGQSRTLVPFSVEIIDLAPNAADSWQQAAQIFAQRRCLIKGTKDRTERFDASIITSNGSVLASISGLVARDAAGRANKSALVSPVTEIGRWAFKPVWRPVSVPASSLPERVVLVVGPGGQRLADLLSSCLSAYNKRLLSKEIPEVLAQLVMEDGALVIVVGPEGDGTRPPLGMLGLLRALKSTCLLKPLTIRLVASKAKHPSVAAISGLIRVAAKEAPSWSVACIEVPDEPSDALLKGALSDPGDSIGREIRLTETGRLVARLERMPFEVPKKPVWREGGHVVILGGAGGIGSALAKSLAKRVHSRFTLVGRSPENSEIRALIEQIESAGGSAVYFSADGTNAAAISEVLSLGRKVFGPIHIAIHSAIVMEDRALERMDDEAFIRAFSIKASGTLSLAEAVREDPLESLVLFSSANSFAAMPGQANYVAGCLAKDAIGRKLAKEGWPVRLINWGFWGDVGRVATSEYHQRLERFGVKPLTTEEGLDAVDRALSAATKSAAGQVLVLKATKETMDNLGFKESDIRDNLGFKESDIRDNLGFKESDIRSDTNLTKANEEYDILDYIARSTVARWLVDRSVLGELGTHCLLSDLENMIKPAARHNRLVSALIDMLVRDSFLTVSSSGFKVNKRIPETSEILAQQEALVARNAVYRSHIDLLVACLANYDDVLHDDKLATDVLFPGGGLDFVSPMYAGNLMVDAFNNWTAEACVASLIKQRRGEHSFGNVLEFGGGTGSLTSALVRKLDAIGGVASYRFTDLSLGFCRAADTKFGPGRPWFKTSLLDISRYPEESLRGEFNVVVGANVIHATPSIADSLSHARTLLTSGGTLVLYEMMALHDFVTVTFGLLDGWWVANDMRLPHSPLLDANLWRKAVTKAGFEDVTILDGTRHGVLTAQVPTNKNRSSVTDSLALIRPTQSSNPLIRRLDANRGEKGRNALAVDSTVTGLIDAAKVLIIEALIDALEIPPHEIHPDRAFADFGADSILSVDLITSLNEKLGIELKPTILFSYTTVAALASYLAEVFPADLQRVSIKFASVSASSPNLVPISKDEFAIAIIGMSGRFPGSADLDTFWMNLKDGNDQIKPVPLSRWNHASILASSPAPAGHTDCPDGGFLSDVDLFDPMFFGLSPSEATVMDPQQRLLLGEAWRALEDAGRAGDALASSLTGVFIGTVTGDYAEYLRASGLTEDIHTFIGNTASMTASRIAYHLNLNGPTLSIDTACSSSLVAVHQAVESLRAGGCEIALAGGVAVMNTPRFYIAASSAGMLSPTGRCHTLGANADGLVPSEGVGVFVLRRLTDAVRDGDPVRAIIRASAINQDGASNGITAPNGAAQVALLKRIYSNIDIDPSSIGLIELHGTGTKLGDPIEMEALESAFDGKNAPQGGWPVTSVKSFIGHSLAAAGVAGLAKLVLALEHRVLLPILNINQPNPLITSLVSGRFRAVNKPEPWLALNHIPRRAGVSSFGFGGTNAHVIVEEWEKTPVKSWQHGAVSIVLSAATQFSLQAYRFQLADWLEDPDCTVSLGNLALTLALGRKTMRFRAAFVVEKIVDLITLLRDLSTGNTVSGSTSWHNLARGFLAGDRINWNYAFAGTDARKVHLPTTIFDLRRCWPDTSSSVSRKRGLSSAISVDLDTSHYTVLKDAEKNNN
ncbi:ptzA [Candidatus Endolissoclinum faulkneri L5]|uniref:PtzA n=1 Tax=Candidatus Endolissoclinum faulkneri L5 TaxID=1401328 RepID=V9TWB0_9PROT|nr:SDR family NAD(P)-dependent oxidoreductase [Candidatus Endolissoclinum faulkneri]AHC73998.1 ptzA [Candidatus Endolissoclinum faulkneri L5]